MVTYLGDPDYSHARPGAVGVLVTNLGTPDAPTTAALRRYLAEFLSDPRVVEAPRLLWWLVLHGVILRIRPRRSAEAYRRVWDQEGSPLKRIAERQTAALHARLQRSYGDPVHVVLGMRYGEPSLARALETLREANVERLLVLPLYPQYSATSTASTFDALTDVLRRWRRLPELRFVTHYHDHPGYVAALAASIREAWEAEGIPERLLFSFHGIPQRYFRAGDPYFCHCQKTARLVAERLDLPPARWTVAFQSRFGREPWLEPYTDHLLREWGEQGVRRVAVVCPGFSADCLETLEEIAMLNRDVFLAAGGESFHYIPALNERADHMEALAELILERTQDWREGLGEESLEGRARRARALGAAP
ncbi:MAG: ferrochelatase [Gammaproteobacteria bacterium]|nr:ferrochelatase [Gammaproteobacteria bacterium]